MRPPESATPRPAGPNEAKVDCKSDSSYCRERKGEIVRNETSLVADAQRRVLGALMRDPKEVLQLAQKLGLTAQHFPDRGLGRLWKMVLARVQQGLATDVVAIESDRFGLGTIDPEKDHIMRTLTSASLDPANSAGSFEENARLVMGAGTVATSTTSSEKIIFEPEAVYYDGPSGKYLVDAGDYFRTYGRKTPVVTGVQRHFVTIDDLDAKEAKQAARDAVADAEVDRHVEWSGSLAGHRKGLIQSADGKPMLVLTSPALPEPKPGAFPVISGFIREAFPDPTQKTIFMGWLAGSYRSVKAGVHHPAPMLCLAGKPNAGKSLLAFVVKQVMGGRSANPHNAWSGGLVWNDDLFSSELLLLDDCQGSTDHRSRMNFASAFKESIYSDEVQLRKRNTSSLSARPVWRVMVCCNDTPENLLVLPPINSDTSDKVILLKTENITPPVNTSTPEGKQALRRMIIDELPAFVNHLDGFKVPDELSDSRSGVMAWRHPELVEAIESMKPEARLEEILSTAFSSYLWEDLPATLTANEIESRLLHRDSPVQVQAKSLFGTWSAACGTYLGRLADGDSPIIEPAEADRHLKVRRFFVKK